MIMYKTCTYIWTLTIFTLTKRLKKKKKKKKKKEEEEEEEEEEARQQLRKNVVSNIEQVLAATSHKAPTIRPPATHYENYTI